MTEREFFERYNKEVYRTCYYMLRNASDAEDICQEVFIKALSREWFQIEHQKTWLMRITVNCCLNHLKSNRTRRSKEALVQRLGTETEVPSVHGIIEGREREDECRQQVSRLPDKIRTVITLRYTNELSYQEIASVLDIPVGTVKSRLHNGLKMMKVMMKDKEKKKKGGKGHEEDRGHALRAVGR